jgi:3-deoxy-D-manno-octulosonic-acid transferase
MRHLYAFFMYLFQALLPVLVFGGGKWKRWKAGQQQWNHDIEGFSRGSDEAPWIWFHCASVGEFEQAKPVIQRLKKEREAKIAVTFFSPSGFEAKQGDPLLDFVTYLPLDTPANAKRFLEAIKPAVAIFVKYELWFNFMHELHQRNIPMTLISAHFTDKHWSTQWPGIHLGQQLADFDRIFTQSEASVNRLESAGIRNAIAAGDTRVDRVVEVAQTAFEHPTLAAFAKTGKVLVVGSNWPEDDAHLIPVLRRYKELKVMVVPHELKQRQLDYWKEECEQGIQTIDEAEEVLNNETRVIYINRMGMLSHVYRYADVAYVGGGFGKAVHNTLEAAVYGIPVIFGPNNKRFLEIQRLKELGIGQEIKDDTELEEALARALEDEEYRNEAKARAEQFIQSQQGATDRIVRWIEGVIS